MSSSLTLTPTASIEVTKHGAIITGNLSQKEWIGALQTLKDIKTSYLKALGDVVSYGRSNFGDEVVGTAIEQLEFDLQDANTALGISTLTYDFRKAHPLSPEHYFILSKLTSTTLKEKWAHIAVKQKLTPLELQRSIEKGEILRDEDVYNDAGRNAGITTIEGSIFQFNQWKNQLGEDKILHLPRENKLELLEKLSPVIDLVEKLANALESDPA